MPNSEPRDRFVNPYLTLMSDSCVGCIGRSPSPVTPCPQVGGDVSVRRSCELGDVVCKEGVTFCGAASLALFNCIKTTIIIAE